MLLLLRTIFKIRWEENLKKKNTEIMVTVSESVWFLHICRLTCWMTGKTALHHHHHYQKYGVLSHAEFVVSANVRFLIYNIGVHILHLLFYL